MLRVGTDCSGLDSPIYALNLIGIEYEHVFSSEIDASCIKTIKANNPPKILYGDPESSTPCGDITVRDVKTVPSCDLYVCGFPCQPFSLAGSMNGFDDRRGVVFFACAEYIRVHKPKYYIFENVKNLKNMENGYLFKTILETLESIPGYSITHEVVNTKDYGIPQNRNRLYIVGVRQCRAFKFPETIPCPPLEHFVDREDVTKTITTNTKADRAQICRDLAKEMKARGLPVTYFDQLHMQRSASDPIVKKGYPVAPCITCNSYHWNVTMDRRANLKELMMLQGLPTSMKVVVSDSAMRKMIGNSMSVNVLFEIISNLLRPNC